MQGAPASVAVGFLLAAPTINPVVIWATWTAFRDQPEIVVLRVVLSLFIATTVGAIFSVQTDMRPLLQPAVARCVIANEPINATPSKVATAAETTQTNSPLLRTGTFMLGEPGQPLDLSTLTITSSAIANKPIGDRLRLFLDNTVGEIRELGGVLVLGSAIAAIIQVGIPREIIINLGQGPVSSIIAMMTLAAVVSICSTVDSFFALSFASTFTSGSLLAFLIFGPMIDIKAIGLILSIFKRRAVIYLFALVGQLAFFTCLFINLHIA